MAMILPLIMPTKACLSLKLGASLPQDASVSNGFLSDEALRQGDDASILAVVLATPFRLGRQNFRPNSWQPGREALARDLDCEIRLTEGDTVLISAAPPQRCTPSPISGGL